MRQCSSKSNEHGRVSVNIGFSWSYRGNQYSIGLLIGTDHVIRRPDINKLFLLVERNGAGILLPDSKPDMSALQFLGRAMNRPHER